jgi:hypothetical protein
MGGGKSNSSLMVDRLEAEGYITLYARELLDKRASEIGGGGFGQVADTRRFSIPVSWSIRFVGFPYF